MHRPGVGRGDHVAHRSERVEEQVAELGPVAVDRGAGDAGPAGDGVDREAFATVLGEEVTGDGEHVLACA